MGTSNTNMLRSLIVFALAALALASAASYDEAVKPLTLSIDESWLLRVNASTHYDDPKPNGCLSDEMAIQIQGVGGDVCTPKCPTSTVRSSAPRAPTIPVEKPPAGPSRVSGS